MLFLSSLSNWHKKVDIVKNGKGNISLKFFYRSTNTSEDKYVPQYNNFRSGVTHINSNFKNIATTYGLQKGIFKKELVHDEVFEDTWMYKKDELLDYGKKCFMYGLWLP